MPQTNPKKSKKKENKKVLKNTKKTTVVSTQKKEKIENSNNFNFQVGDYIVYPSQGIGKIESIEYIKLNKKKDLCYVIKISDKNLTIKIPVENINMVGIRPIISKNDVKKVYKILEQEQEQERIEEDWKIRYQNNLNRIKSGSIFEIAKVCKSLYKRAADKELSLMERRLYETAFSLVAGELSVVKNISIEEAKTIISELLSKN